MTWVEHRVTVRVAAISKRGLVASLLNCVHSPANREPCLTVADVDMVLRDVNLAPRLASMRTVLQEHCRRI